MKIVIYPAVEPDRLTALQAAAPGADWVNAATAAEAEAAMPGADAFLGKITPAMLARADRLVWVQAVHGQSRALHVSRAARAILVC